MTVNGEGIYATRPWGVYGEGPSVMPQPERQGQLGFNESRRKDLTPEDVRFTVKGKALFAFVMGWPEGPARIKALAAKSAQPVKVRHVEMLGHKGKLKWVQGDTEVTVDMPPEKPCEHAVTLKVTIA